MLEQEVDGVLHVLIPKDDWEKVWKLLDKIENMGD